MSARFKSIVAAVAKERKRQDSMWGKLPRVGDQITDTGQWALITQEELGEAAKAFLTDDPTQAEKELIEAAAVIMAWIEDMMIKDGR